MPQRTRFVLRTNFASFFLDDHRLTRALHPTPPPHVYPFTHYPTSRRVAQQRRGLHATHDLSTMSHHGEGSRAEFHSRDDSAPSPTQAAAVAAALPPLCSFTRDPISSFYSGRGVFVTGATGFLGKVVLEKLLRQSPDIGVVFVLIRPRGKTKRSPAMSAGITGFFSFYDSILRLHFYFFPFFYAAERLVAMTAAGEPLWNRLDKCHSDFRRKLVAISGEIASPNLGMSADDRALVSHHCSVVLHLAATGDFIFHSIV